jgi:hypothetical protein
VGEANAARLAADQITKAGGVNGHKLVVDVRDDLTTPAVLPLPRHLAHVWSASVATAVFAQRMIGYFKSQGLTKIEHHQAGSTRRLTEVIGYPLV